MAEEHGTNGAETSQDTADVEAVVLRAAERMRALESALHRRYQFANQHDLSFRDPVTGVWKRNMTQALGYAESLRPSHYRGRYERGGIAECIVEAYPNATWPLDLFFREDEDPEVETEFELAAESLVKDHDLWSLFWRADVLKELGHYSVIVIGAPGPLNEEMPKLSSLEDIAFFQAYGESSAKIERLVGESGTLEEMSDPRFGLPESYLIDFGGSTDETTKGVTDQKRINFTKPVHWSRVIHLSEGALESELYGKPRLRSVWNLLDDLYKVTGGGSESAWRNMDPKRMWNIDPAIDMSATMKSEMKDAIEDMRHGLENDVRMQGVTANQLSNSVHNFGPNATAIVAQIAGTTRIPQRKMLGSERGEQASTQDDSNWWDQVDHRWSRYGDRAARALIDRLIEYGAIPEPAQYEIVRPARDEPTDEGRASVTEKMARANQAQKAATGKPLFTSEQIVDHVWDMEYLVEGEDFQSEPDAFLPEEDVGDPLTEPQGSGRPN